MFTIQIVECSIEIDHHEINLFMGKGKNVPRWAQCLSLFTFCYVHTPRLLPDAHRAGAHGFASRDQ